MNRRRPAPEGAGVTPGLTWRQAMILAQSGIAVTNTVPGGSGIGVGLAYAMLEPWGSRAG
jgi:uncharacterized membrane protein YbhN (UPF0104 family)